MRFNTLFDNMVVAYFFGHPVHVGLDRIYRLSLSLGVETLFGLMKILLSFVTIASISVCSMHTTVLSSLTDTDFSTAN